MATATVKYLGNLRTECTHIQSGTVIKTDAPVDNRGKGELFSPTDLVATAYASCLFTFIGIYCNDNNIPFTHGEASVTKIMSASPRRIAKLEITLDLSENKWDEKTAKKLIKVGKACPVALTVGKDTEIDITFNV